MEGSEKGEEKILEDVESFLRDKPTVDSTWIFNSSRLVSGFTTNTSTANTTMNSCPHTGSTFPGGDTGR